MSHDAFKKLSVFTEAIAVWREISGVLSGMEFLI